MRPYLTIFRSAKPFWLITGVIVVLIAVSVIAGAVAASSNALILALFVAAGAGGVILFYPLQMLWILVVGALIVTGLTELYVPAVRQIRWGVVLGVLALGVVSFLSSERHRAAKLRTITANGDTRVNTSNYSLIFALLFFYYMCVAALVHGGPSVDDLLGIKNYFQVWGFLLVLSYADVEKFVVRFPNFLVGLAALQVPFALHQFFFLVPIRMALQLTDKLIVPVDVIAGTFVASLEGGGANASMACLQVIAIVYLFALWRLNRISSVVAGLLSLWIFIPVAINESKIVFLILPAGLACLFIDTLKRHIVRWIAASGAVVLLLVAVAAIYAAQPTNDPYAPKGFDAFWEGMVAYNFDENTGYADLKLNRTTVYGHWYREHAFHDMGGMVFGHGAGESVDIDPKQGTGGMRATSLATVRYHKVGIGLTGFSTLLWETGLVGTALVLGIFWSAYRSASRLADHRRGTEEWAILKTIQASMVIFFIVFLQGDIFSFEIGFQTLFVLLLGVLGYYHRTYAAARVPDTKAGVSSFRIKSEAWAITRGRLGKSDKGTR